MGLPGWRRLWLLGAAAAALLLGDYAGGANHSLTYFMTGVSESGQGLPAAFSIVGDIDGQPFVHYDSVQRRLLPRVPWIQKVVKEDPQYWDRQTRIAWGEELRLRREMGILGDLYEQRGGLQTLQLLVGCQLSQAGHRRGFAQYGYDGRDFVAFDKETLTWAAADNATAQAAKRRWDADCEDNQYRKSFVEEICIEWLQKYLRYGREALLRKEPPVVKVTRRVNREDLETLFCRVHGFYPKEIDVAWRKDGEVRQEDTFRGVVSPNADGTYYTWLSIDIDPKDRSQFRCHVDHDGLLEPLDMALEESGASVPVWFVVGAISGALALPVTGIALYARLGKGPVRSLLSKRPPPPQPASLEADLGLPPVSFHSKGPEATESQWSRESMMQ